MIECGIAIIYHPTTKALLVSKRLAGDTYGGFWEFPGGKIKSGESIEECVIREAHEEVGLSIAIERFIMTIERKESEADLKLHFYECKAIDVKPVPLECSEVRWIQPEELTEYKFPPANEKIIDQLIKNSVCN